MIIGALYHWFGSMQLWNTAQLLEKLTFKLPIAGYKMSCCKRLVSSLACDGIAYAIYVLINLRTYLKQ